MKKIIASLLVGAQFVFLGVGFVQADGMVVKPSPFSNNPGRSTFDFVRETDQQAFINYVDGEEKMIISVGLDKNESKEAFWIFPVPANPETVKINILKEIPDLKGEEVRQEAKVNLDLTKKYLDSTQIYPVLKHLFYVRSMSSVGRGGSASKGTTSAGFSLGAEQGSKPDVEVFEHIEKEGLISEVITAQTLNGLKEYLEKKNIKIDADSLPILGDYLGKNFSFVVSWMDSNGKSQDALTDSSSSMIAAPPSVGNKEHKLMVEGLLYKFFNDPSSISEEGIFASVMTDFENYNPDLKKMKEVGILLRYLTGAGNVKLNPDIFSQYPRIKKAFLDFGEKHPNLIFRKNAESSPEIDIYSKTYTVSEFAKEILKDPKNFDELKDFCVKTYERTNNASEFFTPPSRGYSPYDNYGPGDNFGNILTKLFLEEKTVLKESLLNKLMEKIPVNNSNYVNKNTNQDVNKNRISNKPTISQAQSQKGIFVSFPTDKIYFPLYPTSVYGENKIPVEIRVMGIKKPKIYQNIKNATKVQYFINNNTSYTVENKDFFGSNPPSRYTKIKIDTQPKFFTEDLWISNYPPVSILPIVVMAEHSILLFIALLVVVSILAGAMTTVIFRQRIALSGERKITYIKYSLLNCFSIVALLVGLLVWKKKVSLDDRPLQEIEDENKAFDKLRENGYSEWTIRFLKSRRTKKMGGWLFSFVFSLCFLFLAWAVTLLLKLLVSE